MVIYYELHSSAKDKATAQIWTCVMCFCPIFLYCIYPRYAFMVAKRTYT